MPNHEARDKLLDSMLGIPGKAQTSRGKVRDAKKKLDEAGVEHKAAKDGAPAKEEATTKGLVEDIRDRLAAAIGEVLDSPPEGLVDSVLQVVISSAMEAPPEEAAPTVETPEGEESVIEEEMAEHGDEEDEDEDEEEMMMELREVVTFQNKAVKLIDSLTDTQAELAADFQEIKDGGIEQQRTLKELVGVIQSLTKKVEALETQLDQRPRMASRARETQVETHGLSKEIQESLIQKDKFWKVPVKPEGI